MTFSCCTDVNETDRLPGLSLHHRSRSARGPCAVAHFPVRVACAAESPKVFFGVCP
jgi:hypothetical protein